jgi:uncharacterized protein (DUF433 family)
VDLLIRSLLASGLTTTDLARIIAAQPSTAAPVFKGTRLTVEHVLNDLGAGMSREELLENYATLKPEHVQAAMLYAVAVVAMDETIYE